MTERPNHPDDPGSEVSPEGSEADLAEQARPWAGDDEDETPEHVPDDAPEADVLDQARPATLDEEDRDR
ncbi:MAG: hypothetical protein M3285_08390 [Actinomycetota bacterium]|nr:hypothetical protein [Actinomycetota bacterium]